MIVKTILSLCLVCTVGLSVLGGPQGNLEAEVRKAIEAGNAQYIKAFASADAGGVAAVYDEDGARLNPKGKVIRGRKAIKENLDKFIKDVGPVTVTLETSDLWLIDDTAFETGKWSYTFTPPGRQQKTIGGRYVTQWRRQKDGAWKILLDLGLD